MNNSNTNSGVNDSLAELLSLPVNFTMDPLLAITPNGVSQKRQASFSSASSVTSENEQSSSESIVSIKKSRLSLDDKDQKTKERILRNRAAAQESRDKKRRYVSDLEASNKKLTQENEEVNKRVKTLEQQNAILNSQLEAFTRQLANLQAQIKFNAATPILFNDFCDSARIAKKESEVAKHDENNQFGKDLLVPAATSATAKLPSPMLSPSFSSDEDSVHSPNTIVIQDFQLDDLFDWDGQQQVANTIGGNDTF
ncbi:hypothetical protein [Parasitella parasitica]|uniref:BZIP domain-containing protein n=1 Tax=Parasitella parasitica TaxID=35722 RepID=A0A0B7NDM8_9FUNG|nr:hypothetical protein [Parasitella parasitica]